MKKFVLFIFICSFSMLYAQDENPYLVNCDEKDGGDCAVVIAVSGLKVRAKPSFDGKTLATAPFGSKITRLAPGFNFTDFIYTPDSIQGNWERIRYGKIEGYAFNAFFGEGIMKIKAKYTLLIENAGYCWNDCYGSIKEHYNYYAVLNNTNNKTVDLKKFTPTFACAQSDMGGISINCPDKRPSEFILITKDEISEGAVYVIEKQQVIKGIEEGNPNEINQKVKIPETNWVLEVKAEKRNNEGSEYIQNVLYLRDIKSGTKQQLSLKDENCNYAKLIWCGDLDRDGIMDFMIQTSDGDEENGTSLFLSRDAPKGKLVKPAGRYSYWDCC
jgi:hypothetical protein